MKELNKNIRLRVSVGEYGRVFKLMDAFTFKAKINGEIVDIDVPAGFCTDFASTPKALWWFFGPIGKHIIPAVVHDYLYSSQIVNKKTADIFFHDAIVDYGISAWKSWLVYKAVRLGGESHFGTPQPKFV